MVNRQKIKQELNQMVNRSKFSDFAKRKLRELSLSNVEKGPVGLNDTPPEIEEYQLDVEFRSEWSVEWADGEYSTFFQDWVLVDEREEGRLFRGLPMPKDFYTSDAQLYADIMFAFVPKGLDIRWVGLQRKSYWVGPCAWIKKLYSEADLLMWSSVSGWPIPSFVEWVNEEQFGDWSDVPLYN